MKGKSVNLTAKIGAGLGALLMAGGIGMLATPAHASGGRLCDYSGSGLCLNRAGNGDSAGTSVIAYPSGNNEGFVTERVDICNSSGTATSTCPLSDGLSTPGDATVVIVDTTGEHCVADSGGYTVLGSCPLLSNGSGGSDGTIFEVSPENYYVNRYTTNGAGAKRWMCVAGQSQQLALTITSGDANLCQFG